MKKVKLLAELAVRIKREPKVNSHSFDGPCKCLFGYAWKYKLIDRKTAKKLAHYGRDAIWNSYFGIKEAPYAAEGSSGWLIYRTQDGDPGSVYSRAIRDYIELNSPQSLGMFTRYVNEFEEKLFPS